MSEIYKISPNIVVGYSLILCVTIIIESAYHTLKL